MLDQLVKTDFAIAGRLRLEQLKPEPIDTLSSNSLIETMRELYEKHGSISVRKDKRYNSNNVTLRFYGHDLQELSPVREAMGRLGFREGSLAKLKERDVSMFHITASSRQSRF